MALSIMLNTGTVMGIKLMARSAQNLILWRPILMPSRPHLTRVMLQMRMDFMDSVIDGEVVKLMFLMKWILDLARTTELTLVSNSMSKPISIRMRTES